MTTEPPTSPTEVERRLAAAYVEMLDRVAQCAQVLEAGAFADLADQTYHLQDRVEGLIEAANNTAGRPRGASVPRRDVVLAEVARRGRSYRVAQLLHPAAADHGPTDLPEPRRCRECKAPQDTKHLDGCRRQHYETWVGVPVHISTD